MYFIYNLLVIVLLVLFSPIILIALVVKPKFRAGFFQKAGFYKSVPKNDGKKTIVIHAVSVGEVIAVEKFIKTLRDNFKEDKIILTTVTKTGNEVANKKLSQTVDEILYFPFDLFFAVKSFVRNTKPDLVIIAETEIWPYFARELKNNDIPVVIINGRISPNSYKGYKKFSWFFRQVFKNYAKILMQTKGDMERIVDVGASKDITEVMGNLKFDISNNLSKEEIDDLKNQFKTKKNPLLVVGSTHKGEDEIALDTYKKLLEKIPDLKVILAPRHPERLKDVESLIKTFGFSYSKRSEKGNFENSQVVLLDTMGELSKIYAIADVAFIGGSFSGTGGHNPLEAAIFDVPVVSGFSTFNFKDIYKFLTEAKASFVVQDEDSLFAILEKLFLDKEFYAVSSEACKKVFEENSGAINYALNVIKELL
ncbi:MAG: 3-deoxy-D-manno-octulosonic acid transferase [bacterium]|nr:3-deoxy-D-manno-octulosonic acid transferase [bacterium]